jgi:hypothetical protein
LLRYAIENKSNPGVVTAKMAIEKLKITTRLKYKTRTNLQIKHHNNHEL